MNTQSPPNTYVCFYNSKRMEVKAPTPYDAQKIAAAQWKLKHTWKVAVTLAELGTKPGEPIIHVAVD